MTRRDTGPIPEELPAEMRAELAKRWNAHLGVQRMGVRLEIVSREELRGVVDPIEPHHRGGMGTPAVNGPIIAAVFDLVTGLTGYLQAPGQRVGVAQLNIQFLRPVLGSRFEVIGRPQKTGKSLVFVATELVDETGVVCATADGIVSVSQAEGTNELAL
ncbi:MAG: PaaI family thioesterase [Gemmatimonadota bacterium]|nr:PaaI family thioesterase [Gemmatimonadota bacterium]MDH5195930.1 PaaI family thioesterase [Gemmatimonadota bacterium]